MKERIMVHYQYQNNKKDKSHNSFFMAADKTNVKVRDILESFPPLINKELGDKGLHLRFLDKFGGKFKCWVDIMNLKAKVPVSKTNEINIKVLIVDDIHQSKIFRPRVKAQNTTQKKP